jgi:hypothetical protein
LDELDLGVEFEVGTVLELTKAHRNEFYAIRSRRDDLLQVAYGKYRKIKPKTKRNITLAHGGKPMSGNGKKHYMCANYERCLDYACVKNWRQFKCDDCKILAEFYRKRAEELAKAKGM